MIPTASTARMTSVRQPPEVTAGFIPAATQEWTSKTEQALTNIGPQEKGRRFAPMSLDKTLFCGEGLRVCPFNQRQLRSSRRLPASVHLDGIAITETRMHDSTTPTTTDIERDNQEENHDHLLAEFFSLKAHPTTLSPPSGKNENSTESGCCSGLAVLCCLNSTKYWGGGACTPTPASHRVGVSGGGGDLHLTPTRCEPLVGVTAS